MATAPSRTAARRKRHARLRLRVAGSAERPRLAVFRSLNQIYAQVIDDTSGPHPRERLVARGRACAGAGGTKTERARAGRRRSSPSAPGPPASSSVVFDRAGFRYHGRIRALADGARESGLDF